MLKKPLSDEEPSVESDGAEQSKTETNVKTGTPTTTSPNQQSRTKGSESDATSKHSQTIFQYIQTIVIFVLFISFLTGQFMGEFAMIQDYMNLSTTFFFYIILFYNFTNLCICIGFFCCCSNQGPTKLQTRAHYAIALLEAFTSFMKHSLRLLSMLLINVSISSLLYPSFMFFLLTIASLAMPRLFQFYEHKTATKILIGAILFMTPVFIHNQELIYERPWGQIVAILWILVEAIEFVLIDIMMKSMHELIKSSTLCCVDSTQDSIDATRQSGSGDGVASDAARSINQFNYHTIVLLNSIFGIIFSLFCMFVFELDQYENVVDDAFGNTSFVVLSFGASTLLFMLYSRTQQPFRNPSYEIITSFSLIQIFSFILFVKSVPFWRSISIFCSVALCFVYVILRGHYHKQSQKNASATLSS